MAGQYDLILWAGNNAPEVIFEFEFDLDELQAVLSIRSPARGISHDFSTADGDSGLTIEAREDEDGEPVDAPGEKRIIQWRYGLALTRALPRHELIEYELELRDGEVQRTYVHGNLRIEGGANAD
ncbi:hypothetical protein ACUSIJ_07725 [Pseudochelatococcus sp. B33]